MRVALVLSKHALEVAFGCGKQVWLTYCEAARSLSANRHAAPLVHRRRRFPTTRTGRFAMYHVTGSKWSQVVFSLGQATQRQPRGSASQDDLAPGIAERINDLAIKPVMRFFLGLDQGERAILYVLLAAAAVLGFVIGRRRRLLGAWRFPLFQNSGEARVSRVLLSHFGPPDYHLLNHVTIRVEDGTTQVDHILVSRFGVFVIETKDYSGWIFANEADSTWTQVLFRWRFRFQNPLFQNKRHVRAVRGLLDFLPPEAVRSIVVFSGDAEFKTDTPQGVIAIGQLTEYLRHYTDVVMSPKRLQLCVGRLETARLAITGATDVEHMQSLARRHRNGAS